MKSANNSCLVLKTGSFCLIIMKTPKFPVLDSENTCNFGALGLFCLFYIFFKNLNYYIFA